MLFVANDKPGGRRGGPLAAQAVEVQEHHAAGFLVDGVIRANHPGADVLRVVRRGVTLGIFVRLVQLDDAGLTVIFRQLALGGGIAAVENDAGIPGLFHHLAHLYCVAAPEGVFVDFAIRRLCTGGRRLVPDVEHDGAHGLLCNSGGNTGKD